MGQLFDPETFPGLFRRIHALSTTADTFTTVALAGSLFFSISPGEAKSKVALYLALTIIPYAIVSPLLAPIMDRGPRFRRGALYASMALRVIMAIAMSFDYRTLLLFPEALGALIASKLYLVTKASMVPEVISYKKSPPTVNKSDVPDAILVKTNSQLSMLSAITAMAAGALAAGILKLPHLGAPWVLRVELIPLTIALITIRDLRRFPPNAWSFPTGSDTTESSTEQVQSPQKNADGQAASVVLVSVIMSVLRAGVGFFTFLVAFQLKQNDAQLYIYALAIVASALGSTIATAITPYIKKLANEQQILFTSLFVETISAIVAGYIGDIQSQLFLAGIVGLVASSSKLSFDAIVQHHVDVSQQAKAFAIYETRFQLAWVFGALVPTLIYIPLSTGDVVIAVAAVVAAFSFSVSRNAMAQLSSGTR